MAKPKPYQRLSIDLSAPKKAWKKVTALQVKVGDIVQGRNRGWVTDVIFRDEGLLVLVYKNGTSENMNAHDTLMVFTEVLGGDS